MTQSVERKDMIGILKENGGLYGLAHKLSQCFEQFTGIKPTTIFVGQEADKMFLTVGVPEGLSEEGLREIFDFRRIGHPLSQQLPSVLPMKIAPGCNGGPKPIKL